MPTYNIFNTSFNSKAFVSCNQYPKVLPDTLTIFFHSRHQTMPVMYPKLRLFARLGLTFFLRSMANSQVPCDFLKVPGTSNLSALLSNSVVLLARRGEGYGDCLAIKYPVI